MSLRLDLTTQMFVSCRGFICCRNN